MTNCTAAADTRMAQETAEAPERVANQLRRNAGLVAATAARLRALDPPFVATLARGSSDHAAAFLKVLVELVAGVPVVSQAPSTGALYHASSRHFAGAVMFAISQSGRSPDLLAAAEDAQRQGAMLIAIVNDETSPLADLADVAIPVLAGAETSVAATKSFIATLAAISQLVGHWADDRSLLEEVECLGDTLAAAATLDWSPAIMPLRDAEAMLVLGRGFTLPIAGEAALKLKETAGLHAEAFSAAEVAHGPMTLIGDGQPILVFGPQDAARSGLAERLRAFEARGAHIIGAGLAEDFGPGALVLPSVARRHPAIAAIAQIQNFYPLAEALARARGRDPDHPPHLAKVTRTL